ncbi:MAG: VacJ family lipoprotein [Pseudomonadota bacterium]
MTTFRAAGGFGLLLGALFVAGCSSPGPGGEMSARDPYESTNRVLHAGNVRLDTYLLRPAAKGYDFITPELFQVMLANAYNHIDTVGDFANYVFQGNVDGALTALGRFTVNSVLGAAGLLDPATEFSLPKEDTDFGVTLGKYGAGEGAYLVLPLLGPSTSRDAIGAIGDRALSPLTYVGIFVDGTIVDAALPSQTVLQVVDARNQNADLIDDLLYESADSYISLRSIYLQRRDSLIRGKDSGDEDLPDIFDEETSN